MVDITPLIPPGRQLVDGYGDGGFRVSGQRFQGSVLILPDRTLAWAAVDMAGATLDTLEPIVAAAAGVDLLLLGCGRRLALVPGELRRALKAAGIVVEAMDTGAACRTYNVLLAEGRRVVAALIAV